jgi:hypothetical protein
MVQEYSAKIYPEVFTNTVNTYLYKDYTTISSQLWFILSKGTKKKSGLASKQCKMNMHMQHQFTCVWVKVSFTISITGTLSSIQCCEHIEICVDKID